VKEIRMSTLDHRRPWTILALLAVAQFMVILDITVVNVALPSIGAELGFAAGDLQWVVTAYVVLTGGLLLLGGRMADLLGRRPVFLGGLALFTAASLVSGLAGSPEMLIAARAAQGLGAALLSPAALSIVTTTYSGPQRTRALSAWGAIGAGGAAAGVLFGGVLTSALSWEWVFFINVPIGVAALALALRLLPRSATAESRARGLDLPGAVTVVAGLVALVAATEQATTEGWGSTGTLVLLAGGAALLATFLRIERRSERPLVPPSTWRIRSLVSSATVMLGATGIMVGTFFLNSLFLQDVLGATALETGLAFLPLVVVIGIAAQLGPHLLARFGARAVIAVALGLVIGANLYLAGAPTDAGYAADLLPGFVVLGFGIGLTFVSASVTSMSEVGHERAGLASGLMTTAHELGAAFGVAIVSVIAFGAGTGLIDGYRDGTLASAGIGAVLVLVAFAAVPRYRPIAAGHAAMH
jgi:EmrB/QacA subfamily drug resistance transporter